MNSKTLKSDKLGIIASFICLVHCIATPFLFMAKVYSNKLVETTSLLWSSLDYVFLIIALYAVVQSVRLSGNKIISYGLSISWLLLLLVILNEKFGWFLLAEEMIYLPTIGLIAFHIYNRRYCACETDHKILSKPVLVKASKSV